MRTLNLGILAHVDAGKTSLTERLLYAAGVIDAVGSVDHGDTQTDTLEQERRRGITIKSAVASFVVGDVTVNLIDTPGHPDFIAEVARVLDVLDGCVLVISAVEGVQAQTRTLMRELARLRIPTLIFINKIDRTGARDKATLHAIRDKLTSAILPMGAVAQIGDRSASFAPYGPGDRQFIAALTEQLAEHDEALLAAYVERGRVPFALLRAALAPQIRRALVHPVYFGSAITGAGVSTLMAGLEALAPPPAPCVAGEPASGTVFKVERDTAGERIAYVRMFAGEVRSRGRICLGAGEPRKINSIRAFDGGGLTARDRLAAGEIGKVWGLGDVRIGDAIGVPAARGPTRHFAPPNLETAISPRRAADRGPLFTALTQLGEQDPLINLRQDVASQDLFVSLYGEVQKEVIRDTLEAEFGLCVDFHETTPLCIERPLGVGEAVEFAPRPFIATIGLRIEPAPIDSGVTFRLEVEFGSMPLSFHKAVEDAVREALRQGLHGWPVTDCVVTMTEGIRYRHWATSTPAEHRNLAPLVLMSALRRAGSRVFEPAHRFHLEAPADCLGLLSPPLGRLGALPETPVVKGAVCTLEGEIGAAQVHRLRQALPSLTRGEGVLETEFDHYRPAARPVPTRPRSPPDALDRKAYLLHVLRRKAAT